MSSVVRLVLLGVLTLAACTPPSETPPPALPEAPPVPSPPPAVAGGEPRDAGTLVAGREMARGPLAYGAVERFSLDVQAGDFVAVVAVQEGIDVALTLRDGEGTELLQVDSPNGHWATEELVWIAEEDATLRLDVQAGRSEAPDGRGRVRLRLGQDHPATGQDQERLAIQRVFLGADEKRRLAEDDAAAAAAAIAGYEEAARRWRVLDVAGVGRAWHRIGLVHDQRGRHREAAAAFEEAARLLDEAGREHLAAQALHHAGRHLFRVGEIETSANLYEIALERQIKLGDRFELARLQQNLAVVRAQLGEYQEALDLYREALAWWQDEAGREGKTLRLFRNERATVLFNRGKCYDFLGELSAALEDLQAALHLRREVAPGRVATTLNAIGQVHEQRGNAVVALDFYKRALDLRRQRGDRSGEAVDLNTIGRLHSRQGRRRVALDAFRAAQVILRELPNRHLEAWTLLGMGNVLLRHGDPAEALDPLRAALRLFNDLGVADGQLAARFNLARGQRLVGRPGEAFATLEDAFDLIESLRGRSGGQDTRSSYLATKQDFFDLAIDLLIERSEAAPESGEAFVERALELSEQARARSQLDVLIAGAVHAAAGDALLKRTRLTEEEINRAVLRRLRLLESDPADVQIEILEGQLQDLLREHQALRGELDGRLEIARPLDAAGVRRLASDTGRTVVEYRLGDRRSFAWVLTASAVRLVVLPGRQEVEDAARRLYRLLAQGPSREGRLATASAFEILSGMVLGPVLAEVEGSRLLVVPDGALQLVPFAALPLPGPSAAGLADRPRLFERYELLTMPSASTFARLRERHAGRPRPEGLLAVVADPVYQDHDPRLHHQGSDPPAGALASAARGTDLRSFERLAFTEQEAAGILRFLPPEKRFAALGFAANRDTVLSGVLSGYRLLHFAVHGDLDSLHPELSRLVLSLRDASGAARDGLLHAHEIHNLELPADLVVLSGCRTALGEEIEGEGLVGFTQAFMSAGASRVLVSLWQVDDRATAELMASFYRRLLVEGQEPAAALRGAQRDIAAQPLWREPYFWAAFVLQGIDGPLDAGRLDAGRLDEEKDRAP